MDHGLVTAPAAAVDDLFVGQHRAAGFAPVLGRMFAVDQALFQEFQEKALLVDVVTGVAGGDFAPPVIGITQALQLRAHGVDVGDGPGGGMQLVLDGGVFGRHAERVPAHGVQDVVAFHAFEPGHHIADGVVAHMPHVDAPRGVGEHFQDVVLGLCGVGFHVEVAAFFPNALPFPFDVLGHVFAHGETLLGAKVVLARGHQRRRVAFSVGRQLKPFDETVIFLVFGHERPIVGHGRGRDEGIGQAQAMA